MHTEMKNNKALQKLYEQAIHIKGGIPHPLIMGTIRGWFYAVEEKSFVKIECFFDLL